MKILLLSSMLLLVAAARAQGSDREKGMQLYRDGQFPAAVAAFRAALATEGEAPELQYNLALASWRAGQLADAETAVEKYVALAGDARTELHAGLLGALRYDEAKALEHSADGLLAAAGQPPAAGPGQVPTAQPPDPLAVLEQAQQKAVQAKDHFVRGAMAAPSPELLRNVERTLRYLDELQKKIDELKKQREEQKKDQEQKDNDKKDDKESKDDKDKKQDDKQDDKKQDDGKKDDQQKQKSDEPPKPGEKTDPDAKPSEGNEGDAKPEPKPGETKPEDGKPKPDQGKPEPQQSPEQKPAENKPEPKPDESQQLADQKPRTDAPGEAQAGKELSPEQSQRLLESLQNLDQKLKEYRARAKSGRRAVERDW